MDMLDRVKFEMADVSSYFLKKLENNEYVENSWLLCKGGLRDNLISENIFYYPSFELPSFIYNYVKIWPLYYQYT